MGRQMDRLLDSVDEQVLLVGKQETKAGVGFPLDRAVGQGSPCSCGETCPCGQGHRCAGKGGSGQGASGYGVLTSYRTLGLP